MPWTPKQFADRHNHGLTGKGAAKAASIASAIVRQGGNEGTAIAVANKYANRHGLKKKGHSDDPAGSWGSLDGS